MASKKVWFVTGCSHGMGNALVRKLLEEGYSVAATSRKAESLMAEFGEESSKFLPLAMNLKDENDVRRAVSEAKEKFGRI